MLQKWKQQEIIINNNNKVPSSDLPEVLSEVRKMSVRILVADFLTEDRTQDLQPKDES
jgi:hypothetical protein